VTRPEMMIDATFVVFRLIRVCEAADFAPDWVDFVDERVSDPNASDFLLCSFHRQIFNLRRGAACSEIGFSNLTFQICCVTRN
jgi:hypothetical protein